MDVHRRSLLKAAAYAPIITTGLASAPALAAARATTVEIAGDAFHINGAPTYPGRWYRDDKVEGLLFISRMANAIIDDHNPETRGMWAYRDGPWDPERNTSAFIAALPQYKSFGLTSVALNIQGGSLQGYGWNQPWRTNGYTPDGHLLPDYRARLLRVLDALDALGMVAVLGLFYIGAKPALVDDAAVTRAADEVTDLICDQGYTHVLIEVGNEIDLPGWKQDIVTPPRSHELVQRIQSRSQGRVRNHAGRLLVSTSYLFAPIPEAFLRVADYVLLHGNAYSSPEQLRHRAREVRRSAGYRGQPLLVNEDDHFDFDAPDNNMMAALDEYVGWGYFDYRQVRDGFEDGFQSLPVDWAVESARKKGFFNLLAKVTGVTPA